MAVEMEKEKRELVIPKPSNSRKPNGIPCGTLSYLPGFKQTAQTLPTTSADPRHRKQRENQIKEPKILGNRTRSGSDEDNMRGWGGFPPFFFFFPLNARFRVQQTLLLALAPTRVGHAHRPAPGRVRHGPLSSPWLRGQPCWDRRSQWVERGGHSAWG